MTAYSDAPATLRGHDVSTIDDDAVRRAIPTALVELLSSMCGVVGIGALNGEIPTIEGTVERDGQSWLCQTSVYHDGALVLTNSVWSQRVPPAQIPAVASLISSVNWALLAGNAEMDHRDGTVRFRTSLCLLGAAAMTTPLAEGLVLPNVGTAALLFPYVAAVASGAADPRESTERMIDAIESGALVLRR